MDKKETEEFKWEEETFHNAPLEFAKCNIEEKTEANTLSWVQKLICRIFKITPEKKFNFLLEVEFATIINPVYENDILLTEDNIHWLVFELGLTYIKLKNIVPISHTQNYKNAIVISGPCPE